MTHLKRHQFAFLSQVMRGPRQYTGATMAKAHGHLRIKNVTLMRSRDISSRH